MAAQLVVSASCDRDCSTSERNTSPPLRERGTGGRVRKREVGGRREG